jgi:hypothetical protein
MTDPSLFHLYVDGTAFDIVGCTDLLETWARHRVPVAACGPTSSG